MSFKNIKGQSSAIEFLKGALENKRHAHAYIFLGPSGIGRKLVAVNFAKALNCEANISERPCDQCASCKKIDSLNHPDIFFLKPEKEGSSIGIDAIRLLIKDITLKPYEGKVKVYIIEDADSMKHEAQNALLKTLEEPPTRSVLILIVESLQSLFTTIVSRSQIVRFFPLSAEEVKDILTSEYKMDGARAHVLSHLSSGRLGEAVRYWGGDLLGKRDALLASLLGRRFFESDFENIAKEEAKSYLDIILSWYRDVLVAKSGITDPSMFVNIDKIDAISDEAGKLSFEYLYDLINDAVRTNWYLDRNVNRKLAFSVLGLKIDNI